MVNVLWMVVVVVFIVVGVVVVVKMVLVVVIVVGGDGWSLRLVGCDDGCYGGPGGHDSFFLI